MFPSPIWQGYWPGLVSAPPEKERKAAAEYGVTRGTGKAQRIFEVYINTEGSFALIDT